jgi:chitin disaccharide deacetylase
VKYCIVNGDDFGASHGIVRGILEAHECGVLTSTSLMVDAPASECAAALARARSRLGVGLHFDLGPVDRAGSGPVDLGFVRSELRRQLERFLRLIDALPTHLDAHHNVQRSEELLPCFREIAACYALPLREHCAVRYFPSFYGRWNGESHPEQISVEKLLWMLEHDVADGITELACHPGYLEPDFCSDYGIEREAELRTLCDPALSAGIARLGIWLIDHRDVPGIRRAAS